ncbi:MAG: hypothetical protein WAM13_16685 [Candidatus Sulfotelmatobacter sp.]
MLPFCLYFVAGIVTGFHVYTLALAMYGARLNPLELVSLLGSLCLLIAAYVSLFKPNAAAKIALLASLMIWCFYGPAIAKSVRTKFDKQSSAFSGRTLFPSPEFRKLLTLNPLSIEGEEGIISSHSIGAD